MLYHEISKDMLLLNPVQVDGTYDTPGALQTIVFLPFFLVFISGLVGFTVKKLVNRPKSISMQIFYDGVVYNQFVIIGTVFCVPLFYNGTQFFTLIRNNIIDGGSSFGVMGSIISYMGVIASIFLIYLFIYILNPKMGETQVSWKKYLTSQQFKMFARLHEVAILQKWYRRNKIVIIILKRLLIALLFYWDNGFEISIFLLEFTNIFYIFTIRPFKIEAYMNIAVIVRLLMFIFYGLVILGNLYYSLGSITFNYESTKTFLTIRDILFLVFFLIIFLLNFYEVYIKCSNLNYQFRLVREENEYKFKIIERQRHDT